MRGALPPVDLRAVCFVRAILHEVWNDATAPGESAPPRPPRALGAARAAATLGRPLPPVRHDRFLIIYDDDNAYHPEVISVTKGFLSDSLSDHCDEKFHVFACAAGKDETFRAAVKCRKGYRRTERDRFVVIWFC